MKRVGLVTLMLTGIAPVPVAAQYAVSVSDTLRYAEITNGRVEMIMPTETVFIRSLHDAAIAVTFTADGRAVAWYDALTLESSGPMGVARPSTGPLLKQLYEFQFSRSGHINDLRPPEMPPEISEMTDLTRQFDDFFITVPAGDLTTGSIWADTVVNSTSAREGDRTSSRHVRSYAVERDTMIDGVGAVLIRVRQTVEVDTRSEMPHQNMTVSSTLTGIDEGWAIFAPSLGRMLERSRQGTLEGEMLIQSPGLAAVPIQQRFTYESRIQLLR